MAPPYPLRFVEAERPAKYYEGGFCPIDIGDQIADRFTVVHKLGHGGFATVWLVRDKYERHGRYVALKVVAADVSDDYERQQVLDILRQHERDNNHPGIFQVELERVFHQSVNGRHFCQVLPVLGPTVKCLSQGSFRLYLPHVKEFARQMARILQIMHSQGVCHGGKSL